MKRIACGMENERLRAAINSITGALEALKS
jgi:hypothetical protein